MILLKNLIITRSDWGTRNTLLWQLATWTTFQSNQIVLVDEAKCFFAEEPQLINKEGKVELENLFATPNEILGSGKDYHYLKPCK